jgi:uncharacterized protein (TIGR03083 family)
MDRRMADRFDALEQTWTSLQSVLQDLQTHEWRAETGCPGWTVQDTVAHLTSFELLMMGEPPPEHALPDGLAHVHGEIQLAVELPIDYRRGWAPTQVLEEFRELTRRRLEMLRADDTSADTMMPFFFGGQMPYRALMALRVFDAFAHEQDVRRATGRNGNLTGPAATIARRQLVAVWTRICGSLPEFAGASVQVELAGEPHRLRQLDQNPISPGPELIWRTSFENAIALGCGRTDADLSKVTVIGDRDLFDALVPHLGFTP